MPQIRCECKRLLSYRAELAGKIVKCPGCAAQIRLPPGLPQEKPAGAGKPAAQPSPPVRPPPAMADRQARAPVEGAYLQPDPDAGDIPLAGPVPTWESAARPDSPSPSAAPAAKADAPRPPPRTPVNVHGLQLELEEESIPLAGPVPTWETAPPAPTAAPPPPAPAKTQPAAARPTPQQPTPQAPQKAARQGPLGAVKGTVGRFLGGLTKRTGRTQREDNASPGAGPG
jgi:hypothetical protein